MKGRYFVEMVDRAMDDKGSIQGDEPNKAFLASVLAETPYQEIKAIDDELRRRERRLGWLKRNINMMKSEVQ